MLLLAAAGADNDRRWRHGCVCHLLVCVGVARVCVGCSCSCWDPRLDCCSLASWRVCGGPGLLGGHRRGTNEHRHSSTNELAADALKAPTLKKCSRLRMHRGGQEWVSVHVGGTTHQEGRLAAWVRR